MNKLIERWMDAPLFNTSVSEADETLFDDTIKALEAADMLAAHAHRMTTCGERICDMTILMLMSGKYLTATQETPNGG